MRTKIEWLEQGVGWLQIRDEDRVEYGADYLRRYQEMAETPIGLKLVDARVERTRMFARQGDAVIDIGCLTGVFVKALRSAGIPAFGFDVNPGVAGEFRKLTVGCEVMTMWDVLEHIEDWQEMVSDYGPRVVLASLPCYDCPEQWEDSIHLRPGEHCWYFSRAGLCKRFARIGYSCREVSDFETRIGRESISTFAFERSSSS